LKNLAESGNPKKMNYLTHSQKHKLELALPKLKLLVWLDQKGLYGFKKILADKGYTDINSLASMSIDSVMKLAKEISSYDGHHLLFQELDKLRKEGVMGNDDVELKDDDSLSTQGQFLGMITILSIIFESLRHCMNHFVTVYEF